MRVFVTGGTGLIGGAVVRTLLAAGHEVSLLSRSGSASAPLSGVEVVRGDPTRPGPWQERLEECDGCVHLAGEPIASGRWTKERRRAIQSSRVESTRLVADVLARGGPTVLVSGSAVGYYGPRGDEIVEEEAEPGRDFLSDVCKAWESATTPARSRARVVLLRTGIVLAREGGALQQMVRPFRSFMGGPIGDGAFWQPWIHIEDEARLVCWALEERAVEGPLNATAPAPVRNRELAASIGRTLGRPSLVHVPVAILRVALGELATVVTTGQRAVPRKALSLGFRFRFPELDGALSDLLR